MYTMENYPNQVGSMMRNPATHQRDSVKITSELDVHGRIRLVYTFIEKGYKRHREFSFTKPQLKEFLRDKPGIEIQFDNNNPETEAQYHAVGQIDNLSNTNFNHLEYRMSDLPLPRSSFEASFQHKHEPSEHGTPRNPPLTYPQGNMGTVEMSPGDMRANQIPSNEMRFNSMLQSNISGNDITYQVSAPPNLNS